MRKLLRGTALSVYKVHVPAHALKRFALGAMLARSQVRLAKDLESLFLRVFLQVLGGTDKRMDLPRLRTPRFLAHQRVAYVRQLHHRIPVHSSRSLSDSQTTILKRFPRKWKTLPGHLQPLGFASNIRRHLEWASLIPPKRSGKAILQLSQQHINSFRRRFIGELEDVNHHLRPILVGLASRSISQLERIRTTNLDRLHRLNVRGPIVNGFEKLNEGVEWCLLPCQKQADSLNTYPNDGHFLSADYSGGVIRCLDCGRSQDDRRPNQVPFWVKPCNQGKQTRSDGQIH